MLNVLHLDSCTHYHEKIIKIFAAQTYSHSYKIIHSPSIERVIDNILKYKIKHIIISDDNIEELNFWNSLQEINKCSSFIKIIIISNKVSSYNTLKWATRNVCDYIDKKTSDINIEKRILNIITINKNFTDNSTSCTLYSGTVINKIKTKLTKAIDFLVPSMLVTGESGTGKELIAQIAQNYLPQGTPFFKINCASLNGDTAHSDLFGHEKGSFTGAWNKKEGLFKKANGGWIFFDEIARLSYNMQAALLRVLEDGEIRPVGSLTIQKVSVKIIAATNENLTELINKNLFRQDLLQRLQTFEIHLPPLRQRSNSEKKEILNFLLISQNKSKLQDHFKNFSLSNEVEKLLLTYSWRLGNVREMKNALIAIAINSNKKIATIEDLPKSLLERIQHERLNKETNSLANNSYHNIENKLFLEYLEQSIDLKANQKINYNALAKKLNISRWKCLSRIKELKDKQQLPQRFKNIL